MPVRRATEFELATMQRIRDHLQDSSSKRQKKLFKRLWAAVMPPNAGPFAMPSPYWECIGFQQADPRTDIRGGGCLALEQLIFFAERFPATFVWIANESQRKPVNQTT